MNSFSQFLTSNTVSCYLFCEYINQVRPPCDVQVLIQTVAESRQRNKNRQCLFSLERQLIKASPSAVFIRGGWRGRHVAGLWDKRRITGEATLAMRTHSRLPPPPEDQLNDRH